MKKKPAPQPAITTGHCLQCDIAHVIEAWANSGRTTPFEVLQTLTQILAIETAHTALKGQEMNLGTAVNRWFGERYAARLMENQMDAQTTHEAGHA